MVWYWTSPWENCASDWKDSNSHHAMSRVAWRKYEDAKRAADAHATRTGYVANVHRGDGRRWRGKIR